MSLERRSHFCSSVISAAVTSRYSCYSMFSRFSSIALLAESDTWCIFRITLFSIMPVASSTLLRRLPALHMKKFVPYQPFHFLHAFSTHINPCISLPPFSLSQQVWIICIWRRSHHFIQRTSRSVDPRVEKFCRMNTLLKCSVSILHVLPVTPAVITKAWINREYKASPSTSNALVVSCSCAAFFAF